MNPFTHRRLRGAVGAYVDGELDPAATAAVAAHLWECWACSGDAEMTRMIKRSLQQRRGRDVLATVRLRRFAARLAD
jgi:anti-sigma factor RsiW